MNVRLKKTFDWYSGVVYLDDFIINHYTAELSMITISDNREEQNIAYDRMKSFVSNVLDSAVFISDDHEKLDAWLNTGSRIIALPDEPVDQIIGIMLYSKLNAVMENRMMISQVEIYSRLGDSMSYLHSYDETPGPDFGQDGWWNDPGPIWYDAKIKNTHGKVVNLNSRPEWKDHGLEWVDAVDPTSHSVVFANFNRDENK